jgi:translation initiation factor IF-2
MSGGQFGMSSRKASHHHKKKKAKHQKEVAESGDQASAKAAPQKRLEIILKCDTSGCSEAIISSLLSIHLPEVEIAIISSGVGAINKSDIFMAETGSGLIIGFNVGIMPNIERMAAEHNIDIRIHDVIYRLLEDVESIGKSLVYQESVEEILGTAKVIALFKSSRKGIILGCEVLTGKLTRGKSFRVLGPMGPMYVGRIESLHIEKDAVREARKGQQVGLKIRDFKKGRIGDLVESFQPGAEQQLKPWQPQGKIYFP